jgi:hypothetical protein
VLTRWQPEAYGRDRLPVIRTGKPDIQLVVTMFQGITLISVRVLSPAWEPLLILTGAGRSHDLEALEPLCRAMQSAAARPSESVRLLRLE